MNMSYILTRNPDTLTITSALTPGASARATFTALHDETTVTGNALSAVTQWALALLYDALAAALTVSDPAGAAGYQAKADAARARYHELTGTPSGALAELVADLKASLQDSAQAFTAPGDADFIRHINTALADVNRRAYRIFAGESPPTRTKVTLVAGQNSYDAPADCRSLISSAWAKCWQLQYAPWEDGYPRNLPVGRLRWMDGARKLFLSRAPTAGEIALYGAEYEFDYLPSITLGDLPDTVQDILLLRAQAEAVKELGFRAMTKPVALRTGTGAPQGAPMQVYQALMADFERRIS